MKTVAEYIRDAREARGLTQRELSDKLLNGYTVGMIEAGERLPSEKRAKLIAAALNLPAEFFEALRSERGGAVSEESASYGTAMLRVPVVGEVAAGPTSLLLDDQGYPVGHGFEYVDVPVSMLRDKAAFAVRVTGDSMVPVYNAGDTLVVSPAATVFPGDDAIVRTRKGYCYLKRIKFKNSDIVLESYNDRHEPIVMPRADVVWAYKVVSRFMGR